MYSTRSAIAGSAVRATSRPSKMRAAAVRADHQLQARPRLSARAEQRSDVVQHREIAQQHARDPGPIGVDLRRDGDPGGRRDGAVDPGESAVGVHRDALARRDLVQFADEAAGAQHQPVVRPAGVPDRLDQHPAGDRRAEGGQLFARERGTLGEIVGEGRARRLVAGQQLARRRDPAPHPTAGGIRVDRFGNRDGIGEGRDPPTRVVVVDAGAAHHDRRHAGAFDQRGHLAAERRVAEHDDPLDPVAEAGASDQLAVSGHQVRAEPRAAGDLGQQRCAELASDLLGPRT